MKYVVSEDVEVTLNGETYLLEAGDVIEVKGDKVIVESLASNAVRSS